MGGSGGRRERGWEGAGRECGQEWGRSGARESFERVLGRVLGSRGGRSREALSTCMYGTLRPGTRTHRGQGMGAGFGNGMPHSRRCTVKLYPLGFNARHPLRLPRQLLLLLIAAVVPAGRTTLSGSPAPGCW